MVSIDEGYHFDQWRKPLLAFPQPTWECGTARSDWHVVLLLDWNAGRVPSELSESFEEGK